MEVVKNPDHATIEAVKFEDYFGEPCSVAIMGHPAAITAWIGVDGERMCLTRQQVEDLLPYLTAFVETGRLSID